MSLQIKEIKEFSYIEEGEGEILLLLHGLFGAISNWESVVNQFSDRYRVIIPMLPIYEIPIRKAGLDGLVTYVDRFLKLRELTDLTLMGNSLGGHIALIYALKNPERVKRIILTGSSGLFENTMGGSYPRRGSYEYIKERVEYTFYDPKTVTKEYIDEIFDITQSIPKCLRIVAIAKSAQRHNMAEELKHIDVPTLLIWGLNDTITPPMVGHEFNRLIRNSTLRFIDRCGHAPMMENQDRFNELVDTFLTTTAST